MNTDWQTFLTDAGAVIEGRQPAPSIDTDIICDLSHMGLIRAHGEEAQNFLHNQFSNDLAQVNDAHSQLSAYCNPKGRMLANFRVFKHASDYYLRLPLELVEPTLKRLRMFVLMSKVTLEDGGDTLIRVGCTGANMDQLLKKIIGATPGNIDECLQKDRLTIIRVPGTHPRFEIYGEVEPMKNLWTKLSQHAMPANASNWALHDIMVGIPTILPQTSEAFVPQMANLELVGGVSFKKGCYPGQEVVARMHYLGKLKRRMYRIHINETQIPEPGTELFKAGIETGEPVGKIVDAQPHPDGGVEALAVVQIKSAEQDELRIDSNEGAVITFNDLPYPLDAAS